MSATTFVLVHGAWHDASCWDAVSGLLRAQNHTVLCPDLPGHGADSTALARITLKSYVTSLVNLLDSLTGKAVLVGHSMSGMVISEAASQLPQKISRLIYLSAYLPRQNESIFDLIALIRGDESLTSIEDAMQLSSDKRTCSIDQTSIIPLFYNLTPRSRTSQALSKFGKQATLPLSAKVRLDETALAAIPSTYICCSEDKVIPVHHQRRMLARRTCDTVLQIKADHSPFYSAPEQLAALLHASAG